MAMPAIAPGLRVSGGDGEGGVVTEMVEDEDVVEDVDKDKLPNAVEMGPRRTVGEYPEY